MAHYVVPVSTLLSALLVAVSVSGCASSSNKTEGAAVAAPAAQVDTAPAAQNSTAAPPAAQPAKSAKKGAKAARNTTTAREGEQQAAPTAVAAKAENAVAASPAATGKIGPGMNAAGDVVDSSKVEAGYGQKVKGLGEWEGEITGRPAAGSKFSRLQIGMPMKQVTDLIGQPSDQGGYITGKAFIPYFFGSDRHRQELVYKNQGRLIFAGGSMGDFSSAHLVWIIHNANERAYR